MNIRVLVDNHASGNYSAEWGLSFYIENGDKLLFDFGASDLFLKNAKKLDVDVMEADYFVLSHGHWDHGNGLQYLSGKKLICHPDVFIKRYRNSGDRKYIGLPFGLEEAQDKFELILSRKPYEINKDTIFLGEIPRTVEFESKSDSFVKEDGSIDYVMDDSAIAFKSKKGLIVISGCAHTGICNTVEYAKRVTGFEKVYAVLGGFHLKGNDELTGKTIDYLKGLNIEIINTSHCTQFDALVQFANAFGSKPFHSGLEIKL